MTHGLRDKMVESAILLGLFVIVIPARFIIRATVHMLSCFNCLRSLLRGTLSDSGMRALFYKLR